MAQRRRIVAELGIASEDMGLAPYARVSVGSPDAEVVASTARWRAQRRWLNQHRAELARLAVDLYPEQQRVPGTPLIADPRWIPSSLLRGRVSGFRAPPAGAREFSSSAWDRIDSRRWSGGGWPRVLPSQNRAVVDVRPAQV